LCGDCTDKVRRSLESIAGLMGALRTTAAGQAVSSTRTARVKGTGHSNGVSVHAIDVLGEVRMVVTGWLRVLLEDDVSTELPKRHDDGFTDTGVLCAHLASRMGLARLHDAAPDLYREVMEPSEFCWQGEVTKRPPLLPLVRQVIDTHRGSEIEAKSREELAKGCMDEWWPLEDIYEILPRFLPRGVQPPSFRTLERWAKGSPEVQAAPATAKRKARPYRAAVKPKLSPNGEGHYRVGSVISLADPEFDAYVA
jgi:hypothetical protein